VDIFFVLGAGMVSAATAAVVVGIALVSIGSMKTSAAAIRIWLPAVLLVAAVLAFGLLSK
jgi:hypothetical protein